VRRDLEHRIRMVAVAVIHPQMSVTRLLTPTLQKRYGRVFPVQARDNSTRVRTPASSGATSAAAARPGREAAGMRHLPKKGTRHQSIQPVNEVIRRTRTSCREKDREMSDLFVSGGCGSLGHSVLTGLVLLTRESESFRERGSGADRDTGGRDRTPNDLSRNREFREKARIAKTSAENEKNAQCREAFLSAHPGNTASRTACQGSDDTRLRTTETAAASLHQDTVMPTPRATRNPIMRWFVGELMRTDRRAPTTTTRRRHDRS
jgi:hypothetical protein